MIGGIGALELLAVLGVVLLIFGPKRLPAVGRSLGRSFRELKASLHRDPDADAMDRPTRHAADPAQAALGRPVDSETPTAARASEPARVDDPR